MMTKLHVQQPIKRLEKETKNKHTFTEKKNCFTQILAFITWLKKHKQP